MSAQSDNVDAIRTEETKYCSKCKTRRQIINFVRTRGQKTQAYSVCNFCLTNTKLRRSEQKSVEKTNTRISDLERINSQIDTEVEHGENNEDNSDDLVYNVVDMVTMIKAKFSDTDNDNPINFSLKIELDDEIYDTSLVDTTDNQDSRLVVAQEIAKHLQEHVEKGSEYYWEIRNTYINKKYGKPSGVITIYFSCTQRNDCECSDPNDNESNKREREVRPAIERYSCKGSITMKINYEKKRATISVKHQLNHPKPTHKKVNISPEAVAWIETNLNYGLRKIEFYRRLSRLKLINPEIHTYQQVYYWVAKLSKKQFVMDSKNQLVSSKNYIEQCIQRDEYYKVIYYLENDFVRALGYVTPFLQFIGSSNITELVIDSTFKTNQEHFELFAVVINNGSHGVPLAYLYLDTFVPSEDISDSNNDNQIQKREEVLYAFFLALRQENISPTFVLVDKDIGQINAIEAAWDKRANIHFPAKNLGPPLLIN